MPHTEELLNKWIKRRPDEKFIKDGIINISEWVKTQEKILFLLKEVNLAPGSWSATRPIDIQRDFRKTADQAPWKEIGQWAYGVLNRQNKPSYLDANDQVNRSHACRSVAIVNLKKTGGGNSSNPSTIRKYAIQDADLFREQVDLIDPNIIVCCGKNLNFNIAKEIFHDACRAELIFERRDFIVGRLFKGEKYFWIDYVHPQMRARGGTHEIKFSSLLNIAEKIP
jgi:hypothetical protein